MPIGREVVILGGELVGLELAEFLIERGRRVSVLEEGPRLGAGLAVVRRLRMLADLREHGAGLYAGVQEVRIEADCVCFTDASGRAQRIHADHVIVAMGTAGDSAQAERFGAAGLRVHEIGDGRGIGYIEGAMRDAMEVVDAIQG